MRNTLLALAAVAVGLTACRQHPFATEQVLTIRKVHDAASDNGGYLHARSLEDMQPFFCLVDGVQAPCPTGERPANGDLSCDAAGCHGDYDYQADTPVDSRQLHGGEAPSCFACHERNWLPDRSVEGGS